MQGVGGIKAGKAFILIEAVDATGKVLEKIRNRLGKFGTELTNVGKTIAMRAGLALTPIAFATKAGTSYDDIMRKVAARSDGTANQMDKLREQTIELGRALGVMPSRMGGIQNIFAQAGFNRGDIAKIGPAVATLSRAGGEGVDAALDTENSAKALSAILRGYNLDASKAADVTDALAVALNASNFSLEDITTSLQYAVPAAASFGVPMEEMLAILGAMRDLQIDASIAGTAFRNMMGYMSQAKEQEKFNEQLEAMTGRTVEFTDAAGNLQSPMKLLVAVMNATKDLGTAERSDLITQLLETRATVPGMAVGKSVERMSDMLTRQANRKGAAEKVRKKMDSGLGGSFRRLLADVEALSIAISNALGPSLLTIGEYLSTVIKSVTEWITANQGAFSSIVLGVAALGGFGLTLVVVGQGISLLASSMLFLTTPLRLLPTLLFSTAKSMLFVVNGSFKLIAVVANLAASILSVVIPAVFSFISSLVSLSMTIIGTVLSSLIQLTVFMASSFITIVTEAFLAFGIATVPMMLASAAVAGLIIAMADLNDKLNATPSAVAAATESTDALATSTATNDSLWKSFVGTLYEVGNGAAEVAAKLYNDWTSSFDSIFASIKNGNIEDAMAVMWATIKVTWAEGVNFLMTKIEELLDFLGSVQHYGGMSIAGIMSSVARPFSSEYADALDATIEGTNAEFDRSYSADKHGSARSKRQASIDAAREALNAAKGKSAGHITDQENQKKKDREAESIPPPYFENQKHNLLAGANSLIGIGGMSNTQPKGAIEAIQANSVEGVKAFLEAQYEANKDDSAKKSEQHLAAIRRRIEEARGLEEAP